MDRPITASNNPWLMPKAQVDQSPQMKSLQQKLADGTAIPLGTKPSVQVPNGPRSTALANKAHGHAALAGATLIAAKDWGQSYESMRWQLPNGGVVTIWRQKLFVPVAIETLTMGNPNYQLLDLGNGIVGLSLINAPQALTLFAVTPDGNAYQVTSGPSHVMGDSPQNVRDRWQTEALPFGEVLGLMYRILGQ